MNIGIWQGVGDLLTDGTYRFSLRARSVGSANQIAVQFSDDLDDPIGFGSAEKIYIDDVSLRKVVDSPQGLY